MNTGSNGECRFLQKERDEICTKIRGDSEEEKSSQDVIAFIQQLGEGSYKEQTPNEASLNNDDLYVEEKIATP